MHFLFFVLVVVVVLATVVADEVAVVDSVGDAKNSGTISGYLGMMARLRWFVDDDRIPPFVDVVVVVDGNKDNRHPTKPLLLRRRCEFEKAASTRWVWLSQPNSPNNHNNDHQEMIPQNNNNIVCDLLYTMKVSNQKLGVHGNVDDV